MTTPEQNYCKASNSHDHEFVSIGVEIGQMPGETGGHLFRIVCAYCGQVRSIDEDFNVLVSKPGQ